MKSPWTFKDSANTNYLRHIEHLRPSYLLKPGARIAWLGCGDGTGLNKLAREYPQFNFVGMDFNKGYIETARSTAPENATYCLRDFRERWWRAPFDQVILAGIISYISRASVQLLLQERLAQMMNPGGVVVVSYNNAFWWRQREVVRDMVIQVVGDERSRPEMLIRARAMLEVIASGYRHTHRAAATIARHLLKDYELFQHFIMQPDFNSWYPREVEGMLSRHFKPYWNSNDSPPNPVYDDCAEHSGKTLSLTDVMKPRNDAITQRYIRLDQGA